MEKSYSIFQIEGGLGKHVAATAVAKAIKHNHPERQLIVVCAYPEMYLNLPFVDRVYRLGTTPYFYENYILDKDSLIFKHEPYFTTEHIYKQLPLIQNWIKLYGMEYSGEYPELVFNLRQKQIAENKWYREKPIMLIQTNGGMIEGQEIPYSWTRDLPFNLAIDIAKHYTDKGYHVIQITRPGSPQIPNVEVLAEPLSNMELFSLLTVSKKRLFIDSCMQHAAAALNLKSTVLWIGTSPMVFGYDLHDNIAAEIPQGVKMPESYLFDYSFSGITYECPYIDQIDFDIPEIMESINAQ